MTAMPLTVCSLLFSFLSRSGVAVARNMGIKRSPYAQMVFHLGAWFHLTAMEK